MSRGYNPGLLRKRKKYKGFCYRTAKPVEMSGRDWQMEIDLMRCVYAGPDDPGCVHAHEGKEFVYEVYLQ